jgi:SAM-dependent methyltransferase
MQNNQFKNAECGELGVWLIPLRRRLPLLPASLKLVSIALMAVSQPPPDSTARFADRVADYIRYRPGYPRAVIDWLGREHGLRSVHRIADIGSGTGLLSVLFLKNGNLVFGVEPNAEMRHAAERLLVDYPLFRSVDGRAEVCNLGSGDVDWVVVGQAFHWFDADKARVEFGRILRPAGPRSVLLIWNNRRTDSPFLADYDSFVQEFSTNYRAVRHETAESDGRLDRFFEAGHVRATFTNLQVLDFDGLLGRTSSASYMPNHSDLRYPQMAKRLRTIFDQHANDGRVALEYETRAYVGQIM